MTRRLQLTLMFLATLSLGVVVGCHFPDGGQEIDMVVWCGNTDLSTCREICEASGVHCEESNECSAPAYGLDTAQCEAYSAEQEQGVMLDVGCDDNLPLYYGYVCCCQRDLL
jgi:hypothetical protein